MDTKRWINEIDNITQSISAEFGGLSSEQLNWKPNTETWSIGQILDHLIVINKTYFPILEQLKREKYKLIWLGKIDFVVQFFGALILKSVQPDTKRKMKTLPIWEPTKSAVSGEIISSFVDHQSQLRENISTCSYLLDKGVVISSPANRVIVYKLENAFAIILAHEKRHLQQARELNQLRIKSVS